MEQAFIISPLSKDIPFLLGSCYSQIENKEKAFCYLDKSVRNGFNKFYKFQDNAGLFFLRKQPEFKEFVENGYRIPKQTEKQNEPTDYEKLEKLAELKEKNILTNDEFEIEKKKILSV